MASALSSSMAQVKTPLKKPDAPVAPSAQFFDPSSIAKTLKQFESVRGRVVAPGAVESAVGGAIEAQIAPAIARQESRQESERMRAFQRESEKRAKKAAEEEARARGGSAIGTTLGTIVGTGLTGGSPVGGTIGGIVGGVLGGSSVICTELHRQGFLTKKELIYTNLYRKKYLTYDEYNGYLIWASPIVERMKKYKAFTRLIMLFWMPVTIESISKVSGRKGSLMGKVLLPLVRFVSREIYQGRKTWLILAEG